LKKFLVAALLGVIGIATMAAGCQVVKIRLTTFQNKDVFAGELKNDSGVNILQHKFRVTFLDTNNNVVETTTVDGCLRSIKSGTSDFFSARAAASASTTTTGLARLANLAEDPNFKVGDTATGDVTISNLDIRRDGETLKITGKIKNNDSDDLVDPAVCVVVFDEDGNVLVTAKDASLNDLDEDEEDTFSIEIDITDIDDLSAVVDSVDVYADGLDGSSTGKPIAPESDKNNSVTVCATPTKTPTKTSTPVGTATATNTPDPATATATTTPAPTNTSVPPTATPCPN
jgi:hypothetical protein